MPIKVIGLSLTSCKLLQKCSRRPVLGQCKAVQGKRQLACAKDVYGQDPSSKSPQVHSHLGYFSGTGESSYGGLTKPTRTFGDATLGPNAASGEISARTGLVLQTWSRAGWVTGNVSTDATGFYAGHPCRSGKILRRFLFLGIRVLFGILWGAYLWVCWAITLQKSSPKHKKNNEVISTKNYALTVFYGDSHRSSWNSLTYTGIYPAK